jgi:hypothetical protein
MNVEAPDGTHPVDAAVRADTTSVRSSHRERRHSGSQTRPGICPKSDDGCPPASTRSYSSTATRRLPSAQPGKLAFNGVPFRYPPAVEMVRPIPIRWACDFATTHRHGQRLVGRLRQGPAARQPTRNQVSRNP